MPLRWRWDARHVLHPWPNYGLFPLFLTGSHSPYFYSTPIHPFFTTSIILHSLPRFSLHLLLHSASHFSYPSLIYLHLLHSHLSLNTLLQFPTPFFPLLSCLFSLCSSRLKEHTTCSLQVFGHNVECHESPQGPVWKRSVVIMSSSPGMQLGSDESVRILFSEWV